MATQNKSHSEFSMRLNLTFKAGFSEDSSDQLLRDLVAFLKLKRAVGSSNSWIKGAILEAFIRERAGTGESLAQLSAGQLPNMVTQQPNEALQPSHQRREGAIPVVPVVAEQRSVPGETMPVGLAGEVADDVYREESFGEGSYSDLLDEPELELDHQAEPPPAAGLPRSIMSIMG